MFRDVKKLKDDKVAAQTKKSFMALLEEKTEVEEFEKGKKEKEEMKKFIQILEA